MCVYVCVKITIYTTDKKEQINHFAKKNPYVFVVAFKYKSGLYWKQVYWLEEGNNLFIYSNVLHSSFVSYFPNQLGVFNSTPCQFEQLVCIVSWA